ncbi:hypothetical protein BB561_006259 [Smittium simulii]|uniref:HMG box domain-containing protein n=1 Tax=Smittium simulii TaxID=133385 RepID=A0A2T9Y5J3_9FUNG|nr:hypothetical protein BB561_006259 [Smittium simulii]
MLKNGKATLIIVTRGSVLGLYRSPEFTTVLCLNSAIRANFDLKNNIFLDINIRYYSSISKDTNLLNDDKLQQNIPLSHSIKSSNSNNIPLQTNKLKIPKLNITHEAKSALAANRKKAKIDEVQRLNKAKLAKLDNDQKLNNAKLAKVAIVQRLKKIISIEAAKAKKLKNFETFKKVKEAKLAKALKAKKAKLDKMAIKKKLKNEKIDKAQKLKDKIDKKKKIIKQKKKDELKKLKLQENFNLINELVLHTWWDNVDKNLIKLENLRRKSVNKIRNAKKINKLSMLVDPRAPKRPASAYAMFVKDLKKSNLSEFPTQITDFIKYAAAKWKQLPESKKYIYRDKYKAALQLYKEASEKFK